MLAFPRLHSGRCSTDQRCPSRFQSKRNFEANEQCLDQANRRSKIFDLLIGTGIFTTLQETHHAPANYWYAPRHFYLLCPGFVLCRKRQTTLFQFRSAPSIPLGRGLYTSLVRIAVARSWLFHAGPGLCLYIRFTAYHLNHLLGKPYWPVSTATASKVSFGKRSFGLSRTQRVQTLVHGVCHFLHA